ncbi:MAG TPA: hypothetical protein VMF89_34440, partial [Polyangiales bacterium]|nr:hypothetical protein [Polyangiales bacterium]
MRRTRAALLGVWALCCSTCADDTSRKLELGELALRECKSSSAEGELATGRETARFDGLEC